MNRFCRAVSAHGATPKLGKNAILYLAKLLKKLNQNDDVIEMLTTLFHYDYDKMELFEKQIEDESGAISVNLGIMEMNEAITKIKIDLRIPVTFSREDILQRIKNKVEKYGFDIEVFSYLAPLYVPLDSEFLKILLETYQKHTQDYESQPMTSGGGTYARIFSKNSVCFGPRFKGKTLHAHEPNETSNINDLIKALEIYYDTLLRLNDSDKL